MRVRCFHWAKVLVFSPCSRCFLSTMSASMPCRRLSMGYCISKDSSVIITSPRAVLAFFSGVCTSEDFLMNCPCTCVCLTCHCAIIWHLCSLLSLFTRAQSPTHFSYVHEDTRSNQKLFISFSSSVSLSLFSLVACLKSSETFDYIRMIISLMSMVMSLLFFLIAAVIQPLDTKFLSSSGSSSIIVLRHIRLPTDEEFYRVRCPYNLNHLTVTLLNYSAENCFDLYTSTMHNACATHRSPCRFHAKPLQMMCNARLYSNQVDITYQCTLSSSQETK